jgi:hypothetical protein
VHAPVAKSTLCTADDTVPSSFHPPMRSTCPWSLSLSSIATATELLMGAHVPNVAHDSSGGRTSKPSSSADTELHPKISTLAVRS